MKSPDEVLEKMSNDIQHVLVCAIIIAEAAKVNPEYQGNLSLARARVGKIKRQFDNAAISIQKEINARV